MELSYFEAMADLDLYRSLGANEPALARTEGLINHCFVMMSKFSELEERCESLQAQVLSYQEMIFGRANRAKKKENATPTGDATPPAQSDVLAENGKQNTGNTSDKANGAADSTASPTDSGNENPADTASNPTNRHGRFSAEQYTGALVVECCHEHHHASDLCPKCLRGRLYPINPMQKVVIDGQSPFSAIRYLLEAFRCALCGAVFKAQAPEGVDVTQKYTLEAKAVLAYLHYGMGLTYYAIARMQLSQGVPLAQSTQSELVASAAGPVYAVVNHLRGIAREAELIVQDDTTVRIIELMRENKTDAPDRKGMYTTGFVVKTDKPFVLYVSGRQHAGENFDELMVDRQSQTAPIRVADALSANSDHKAPADKGKCNAHAFRKCRTILPMFPEMETLLTLFGKVYDNDAHCRQHEYSPEERLCYHQANSQPLMDELFAWTRTQLETRQVEPNSAVGAVLKYILNHEAGLTLFLRKAGVPIDTNEVERQLKEMIRYRKRSLVFVTQHSADYGSNYMSLIATSHLHQIDFVHYLTQLQKYEPLVWQHPGRWLPWNYHEQIPIACDQAA